MNEMGLVAVGAMCAFIPNLLLQILNNWHQRKLERFRLRDKARRRAYKGAFALARKIRNTCFPLADRKREGLGL